MLLNTVPILASLNTESTITFYTELLGFTFHSEWDGYLIFSRDGIQIHLWPCADEEIAKNTGCYINVDHVDELYHELSPKGILHPDGDLKDMPWGMRQFSILDNNGNIIHFGEDRQDD
ncbi:hypothetical protein CKK33_02580 [Mucilaginibacter sp. MD40]|uniref:bleomycin resistance protein n=1 Tax=Mucilaginibacter sp. MD40 TaxID=2029590 RepID=UPI000BAC7894|nr:VOC family protein [Mucilaginibacter sp. MD40]PAW92439.1 hypothetical protein CKK33_02580 [Mucilaginibacter sp. MD40]